jgi:hypothetical protein
MNQLIRKAYSEGFDSLSKTEAEAVLRCPGFDMGLYIEYERRHSNEPAVGKEVLTG